MDAEEPQNPGETGREINKDLNRRIKPPALYYLRAGGFLWLRIENWFTCWREGGYPS
jgi:hypothetical protein